MSSQVPCLSSSTPPLWSCWPYPHQEERLPKHSLRPSTSGVHIVRAGSYMVDFPLLPPQGCLVSGGGGGRGLTLDECPGPPLHLTSCEQTGSSPNNCIFLADHPPPPPPPSPFPLSTRSLTVLCCMMKFCRHYDSLWTLFHLSPTSMCCMVATNLPVFSPSCMPTGTTRTLGHFYTSHSQFVGGEG